MKEREWEDIGKGRLIDDLYYTVRHKPCGTVVNVQGGYVTVCPKCQPEEYAERERKAGFPKWSATKKRVRESE